MSKVAVNYRVEDATKQWIDLMAVAMGVDKSKVVDDAVQLLAANRRGELAEYLDHAQQLLASDDLGAAASMFLGHESPRGYRGGPVQPLTQKSKA